jgi:hypothetical protein
MLRVLLPAAANSGARSALKKNEKEETRLEQQHALIEAERRGVHKGGVKCARPECAKKHFNPKWSKKDRVNLRAGKRKVFAKIVETRVTHLEM